jgi:aspartate ammonia-lyase
MEVQGLDHAVALGVGAGQLELNTHMPLVTSDCLRATRLLATAAEILATKCVNGLEGVGEACARHLEESAALPTLLNPVLGYDRVAGLVKESVARGKTLRELALEKELLTEAEYEALVAGAFENVRT